MRRLAVVIGLLTCLPMLRATPQPRETRALWVLRSSLTSTTSIDALVNAAKAYGFDTLLVQVRGRADAYYRSSLEPPGDELRAQPLSFDPLEYVLRTGRVAGLRVHAWVNVNLVASASELPISPNHLVYRHPDWLMVPRALAREMAAVESASPSYLGRLARWTRAQPGEVEGLYVSPVNPAATAHIVSVLSDLAARYALDGIHLDYLRYPDDRFDYSRASLQAFQRGVAPELSSVERRRLDLLEATDPLAYPDNLPEAWNRFRRSQLSSLLMRIRTAVKAHRPDASLSVAVAPDISDAFERRLQDWRTWLESSTVDAICPMAYTADASTFASQIASVRGLAGTRAVWAGIGAYRLTPDQTVQHIRIARERGADGFALFSYDSLTAAADARGSYLAQVSRALFAVPAGSR